MIRKRLISMVSAIAMVLTLFTLLPEGALKATAAGNKFNIRTSYNAETGQLTVEWTKDSSSTADYVIHFYNNYANDPGKFEEFNSLLLSRTVHRNQEPKYTTPISHKFGTLYGHGGSEYKVYIELSDHSYGEFSPEFRTNVPFMNPIKNMVFYSSGLIDWEDDRPGSFCFVSVCESGTDKCAYSASTNSGYLIPENLEAGKSYYAEILCQTNPEEYDKRVPAKVRTNVVTFKGKTEMTGFGFTGDYVSWLKYPNAAYYKISILIDFGFMGWKPLPGADDLSTKDLWTYRTSYTPVINLNMSQFSVSLPAKYKVRITAYNSDDEAISETTTSKVFYNLRGDVNQDGKVTADDAIIAARMAAGYGDYASRYAAPLANMNGDRSVTADDAIIIARCAADYGNYKETYLKTIW